MIAANGKNIITKRPPQEVVEPPKAKIILVCVMIMMIVGFANVLFFTE